MRISVISSFGTGKTSLSAFDNALYRGGVHNYNIITLSSIIPIGTQVSEVKKYKAKEIEYGYKLYAVKSDIRSHKIGQIIASGLGWYQTNNLSGIFVEHHASGYDLVEVKLDLTSKIESSIKDLCNFRKITFEENEIRKSISIGKVKNHPCCALTIAVYQTQGWQE